MNALKAKLANLHKSLTIWFNGLAAAALGILPMLQDSLPSLQQYVPDIKWGAAAIIVGNVLLRFKTTKGLQDK